MLPASTGEGAFERDTLTGHGLLRVGLVVIVIDVERTLEIVVLDCCCVLVFGTGHGLHPPSLT